jgi:pimeloyl-ACP methyl ester carboxylesterase
LRSDLRAELAVIAAPTLIVWGERDALLPIALGRALNAALPHAMFISLPACGHRPMLAQPERFSQIVLDFLQANDAAEQG